MNTDILLAIASISAVIISIISMIFTVILGRQQHQDNKKNSRPICAIKFNDYENDISVKIANVGTGPLIVKEIVCDDSVRKSAVLLALMPHIEQYWSTYTEDITGWTIPVGGELILIGVNPENDDIKYQVRSALEPITITVKYTDIYGSSDFTESRNLDFFGRTLEGLKRHTKVTLKKV